MAATRFKTAVMVMIIADKMKIINPLQVEFISKLATMIHYFIISHLIIDPMQAKVLMVFSSLKHSLIEYENSFH